MKQLKWLGAASHHAFQLMLVITKNYIPTDCPSGQNPVFNFYPRDAMLARIIAIVTCLSVRPSVCHEPVLYQNEER